MSDSIAVTGEHAIAYWLSERSRKLDNEFNYAADADSGKTSNYMHFLEGLTLRPELVALPEGPPLLVTADKAERLRLYFGLPLPIHVSVDSGSSVRDSCRMLCHIMPRHLDTAQFIRLSEKILVATPEFALLSVASKLNFVELAVLVCIMCGIFTWDRETSKLVPRRPVTSIEKISDFIKLCQAGPGRAPRGLPALERAVNHAFCLSASPAEVGCGLRFSLPPKVNGYGLGALEHNYKIDTSAAWNDGKEHSRYIDMINVHNRVCIEYQSDDSHGGNKSRRDDEKRRNEIQACGYYVSSINSEHYKDAKLMDREVSAIARKLGRKPPSSDEKSVEARDKLRKEIDRALSMFKSWALA